MKLIYCTRCRDIVNLSPRTRACECGASGGRYTDERNALIWGSAVVLAISNESFFDALERRGEGYVIDAETFAGAEFQAMFLPPDAPVVKMGDREQTAQGDAT
jgi:hypothetical protein